MLYDKLLAFPSKVDLKTTNGIKARIQFNRLIFHGQILHCDIMLQMPLHLIMINKIGCTAYHLLRTIIATNSKEAIMAIKRIVSKMHLA